MSMHAGWMALRTLSSDQSVKGAKLKPGTLKRIASYAVPYKSIFVIYFFALIIDAVLTVATPLLLKELVDKGVIPKDGALVTRMAVAVGVLAVASALINILVRWISSRIGETIRQGPHHSAQKSTITGFGFERTSAWKDAVVTFLVAMISPKLTSLIQI